LPAATVAVILHKPAALVVPPAGLLVVVSAHGPFADKLMGCPAEELAVTEKVLPYCTLGNGKKLMVCDF
jgi:hypothetical protein